MYVWPYLNFFLQIARSDIRPHINWAVTLVFACGHFNIPLGCEWVYIYPLTINILTYDSGTRASNSPCLMVTMLVPHTEKIPLFTDFWEKITPYFSQKEDFCCKKNHPFFLISRRAHCLMTPFETNWGHSLQLQYIFLYDFPLAFF